MAACCMKEVFHPHIPVLLTEAVDHLITARNGIYIDATFGRGSHSQAILNQLGPTGRLIAFDKDPDAITYAKQFFSHDQRFVIFHSSFAQLEIVLSEVHVFGNISGILFDLGVSSPQFDTKDRGFSFSQDGKLDMRMDNSQGEDAASFLARIDEKELANVLWEFGEEKYSRRIARAIVEIRKEIPITSTLQLAQIIKRALPKTKYQDKHPATRSFQAIRIAVNRELTELQQALPQALNALKPGGRLAVISFHSLEDRLVKQFIREEEKGKPIPRGLPIKGDEFKGQLKTLCKPIKPSLQEVNVNPRARSAILRIAEKKL